MVLEECPTCHRRFSHELVSREQVDANEVAKQTDVIQPGTRWGVVPSRSRAATPLPNDFITRIADKPFEYVVFKLTFKCKDCGSQWNKFESQKLSLSKDYVDNEKSE